MSCLLAWAGDMYDSSYSHHDFALIARNARWHPELSCNRNGYIWEYHTSAEDSESQTDLLPTNPSGGHVFHLEAELLSRRIINDQRSLLSKTWGRFVLEEPLISHKLQQIPPTLGTHFLPQVAEHPLMIWKVS